MKYLNEKKIERCDEVGDILCRIDDLVRELKKIPGTRRISSLFELETSLHGTFVEFESLSSTICKRKKENDESPNSSDGRALVL